VWTVKAGDTTNATVSGSTVTAQSAGTLTLTATVANGTAVGTPYTSEDIELEIGEVLLLQKTDATETIVDATYEATLDGAFAYINDNAAANEAYVVLLGADQAIAPYVSPGVQPGSPPDIRGTDPEKTGVKITLRGHGTERKISWDGTSKTGMYGYGQGLFTLWNNNALILDDKITLDGKNTGLDIGMSNHELPIIYMFNAHLTMNAGSKITGVKAPGYGAVTVPMTVTGSITLAGGEISGNTVMYGIRAGEASYPPSYTFTMTSGAIKNNSGTGLYLSLDESVTTATMSGGEISGHTTGNGVNLSGASTHFTMSGGTISGNKIGVALAANSGGFTMGGGTITNNTERGVEALAGTTFTMTEGTISKDGSPTTGVWLQSSNNIFIIDGPVTLLNVFVSVAGASGGVSTIYLGSAFNPTGVITINLYSSNATTNFNGSWGSANGGAFLKGLPTDSPTGINSTLLEKFVLNKVYTTTSLTEKTGGSLSLSLSSSNFGVAKWTEND
jgi:hypothetical protein